ncbi:PREDICTED: uncharacterized protein LOC104773723 [Camelina sativa]|uniref:Uncharacterized protein LOC104773723 n=1 Tax=Camelina sativa TaxID=90675 RepID=A0ABM0Y7B2_CAMSA|nr:PREDICTED: uncharacterized protein LOC104773723 [Camelina sativa]
MKTETINNPGTLYTVPTLNISNCVTVTLTGQNYALWKNQLETFLAGQGLLGFVNGSISVPQATVNVTGTDGTPSQRLNPEYQSEYQNWVRTDSVVNCSTSYQVWNTLANHFNRVSSSRLFELQRKLQTIEKKDRTMIVYLRELKSICDQLASVGSPVTEKMKIFAALNGLGREYEPIKTTIENTVDSVPGPTLDDVIPKITGYDDRLQSYLVENSVTPHLAFNVSQQNIPGYYQPNSNRRGRGNGRFNNSYQADDIPAALTAMRITDVTDQHGHEWLPDSGSSVHVTPSTQALHHSQPYTGSDSVMVGDGTFLPITHTGSASIASTSGNLPLKDVLVCPNIARSLLSVSMTRAKTKQLAGAVHLIFEDIWSKESMRISIGEDIYQVQPTLSLIQVQESPK